MKSLLFAAAMSLCLASQAMAQVRITEWIYSGLGAGGAGEFIEFTNLGPGSVSLTGWSYDDDSRTPGALPLGSLGTLIPGESAIIAEATAAAFRTEWSLPLSVKVLGGNTVNLGRNDEINIYDGTNTLVDRLTYGDQNIPGTIRTQNFSGNPTSLAVLGTNNVAGWVLSANGDSFGSYSSATSDIANPGEFALYVPEPTSLALAGLCLIGIAIRRR